MNIEREKQKIIESCNKILLEQPANEVKMLKYMRRLNYIKGVERGIIIEKERLMKIVKELWDTEDDFHPNKINECMEHRE